ncbi:hypothetical protein Tco_0271464 [Tanacetum coccineum]
MAASNDGGQKQGRRQQQLKSTQVTQSSQSTTERHTRHGKGKERLGTLKDDVETRFNRLGRNDDGLPEEEPNKFQVFRSACKLTGRMKATRLTTDVRQAVVWFVLNNSPEVDADLGLPEKNRLITWKRIFPRGLITSGVSTLGLDGEMYYGQLEEILELTYIGNQVALSPVNDDNANANEGMLEDDVYAHMACVFLDHTVGMPVVSSSYRRYSSMVIAMGETSQVLPLACEWEEIPERIKRNFSYSESYFDLASWYNNQDKVVMGNNVYTVGTGKELIEGMEEERKKKGGELEKGKKNKNGNGEGGENEEGGRKAINMGREGGVERKGGEDGELREGERKGREDIGGGKGGGNWERGKGMGKKGEDGKREGRKE